MAQTILIGDQVKITGWGQLYSTFTKAASIMKLDKFEYGYNKRSEKTTIYTVVNKYHVGTGDGHEILGVSDGIKDLVIGIAGVELIHKGPLKPKEEEPPKFFDINNLYPYTD